ncbi:MAG: Na+:solute symporter [Cyclobacteriaceae bacterium]|nr:Na+:solute symporter [Cyclobacteriaceae bacterium]
MLLSTFDWSIIIIFFIVFLIIGVIVSKKAGKSSQEFFLSGRNMPWWLLGVSMVATTFSADTPNLVTDIVRQNGVSGNWVWWAFLITGMLTVFIYAKLWRRSGVLTDLEFYEMRYSGKEAAFLRGFRSIYLGVFFNIMIMATVCLAAIKIGGILFGLAPWQTVVYASIVTVAYSSMGGLRGVILTDFIQFIIAMIGSIWAAIYVINMPEIGGLQSLVTNEAVVGKLNFLPDFNNWETLVPLFIIPIAVQWWSVWYPGAEPGGGGYIAQRMLSAKDEKNAVGATLFFNIAHYALRPWPWIIIALASLVVYPDLDSIAKQFPNIDTNIIGHDIAYPAMLLSLPKGLIGIVIASLIAAFMSTISTHLNWGSSYVVHDFYQRFVNPEASEKKLVNVGRISTILLMAFAALFSLALSNALGAFQILLQIGAGTGLVFILRWFWWRINAYSEITGMIVSFIMALYFQFVHSHFFTPLSNHVELILGILITTIAWITVTLVTKPTDQSVLVDFYSLVKPYGRGWNKFKTLATNQGIKLPEGQDNFTKDFLSMFLGIVIVYFSLFATGFFIYGKSITAYVLSSIVVVCVFVLIKLWRKKE